MDLSNILGPLTTALDWIEENIIGLLGKGFGFLIGGIDFLPALKGLFDMFALLFAA
jgi:hypothetical protein